jgi:hypothetical protein
VVGGFLLPSYPSLGFFFKINEAVSALYSLVWLEDFVSLLDDYSYLVLSESDLNYRC